MRVDIEEVEEGEVRTIKQEDLEKMIKLKKEITVRDEKGG